MMNEDKYNFVKIFERSLRENWESEAVTDYGTDVTLTYGQLAINIEKRKTVVSLCTLDGTPLTAMTLKTETDVAPEVYLSTVAQEARKPMDVHLMIVHPEKYVERFAKAGAAMISFHYEAALDQTDTVIDLIHSFGVKAGIVINPDVPVEKIFPYLGKVDYVLLMSVFAGFGGQKFIEDTYARVRAVKAELKRIGSKALIEVDGGVSPKNAGRLAKAGVDILVAGSAVFRAEDPAAAVAALREG